MIRLSFLFCFLAYLFGVGFERQALFLLASDEGVWRHVYRTPEIERESMGARIQREGARERAKKLRQTDREGGEEDGGERRI